VTGTSTTTVFSTLVLMASPSGPTDNGWRTA
jgi:hypothetical protein